MSDWHRFYVGQTNHTRRRIPFHISQILSGSLAALHYFICSRGQGFRTATMLKLWEIPEQNSDTNSNLEWDEAFSNVLEMGFCRAFQSLAAKILEFYFGPLQNGLEYANVGLNVLSPLLQHFIPEMSSLVKRPFLAELSTSPDHEITAWLRQRGSSITQDNKTLNVAKHRLPPKYRECLAEAFTSLVTPPDISLFTSQISDLEERPLVGPPFDSLSHEWKAAAGSTITIVHPYGESSSRIAFVFDYGLIEADIDNAHHETPLTFQLPWGFDEIGFTEATCRAWNVAFQQHSRITPHVVQVMQTEDLYDLLVQSHRQIIEQSSHKVIFLCGTNARQVVLAGVPASSLHKLDLRLGVCDFQIYLDSSSSSPRLYVYAPEMNRAVSFSKWLHLRRIDIIIRFAVVITNTEQVRNGIFERRGMLCQLIAQAGRERQGDAIMTIDTMNGDLKCWLYRKGIVEDDIRKVEQVAGS